MTDYSYFTIKGPAQGSYREKGSKFLAYAYPVTDENQIKEKLEQLKKEYFDARHHCYAWVLGVRKERFRVYDDGEPGHTAGDPILGQIRSRNLTNVLVVVVRYFGGVKLGVGGLISAYRTAASLALQQASIVEQEVMKSFRLSYTYDQTPEIMRLIKQVGASVVKQEFESECRVEISMAVLKASRFSEHVALLKRKGVAVEEIGLT
ncbi:MAG: YigZ family protein [Cyclobacteriaceae bacterium]